MQWLGKFATPVAITWMLMWQANTIEAAPLVPYPDVPSGAVTPAPEPPATANSVTRATATAEAVALADSFFLFNRRATTPSQAYTPGKIGLPIELGIYLLSAGASGPTGTVTITLGTDNCIATLVPENPAIVPAFNIKGSRGYCTLTPSTSGTLTLSGIYSGDANNLGEPVGQFLSSANPTVPILAANGTINPQATHFVATGSLPDFAIAGEPSARWMAFTSTIQGSPPSANAVTITAGNQACNPATPATQTALGSVLSERGILYTISHPVPLDVCEFTFAQTGYADLQYAFAGDATYTGSSESSQNELYVLPAGSKYPVQVTVSISSALLPLVRGSSVPVTATVLPRRLNLAKTAPPYPTGTVTIRVGSGSCTGTLSAPTLTVAPRVICAVVVPQTGDLAINAAYSGDALHQAGTASPIAGGSASGGTTSYTATTSDGTGVTATITATGSTSTCTFTGAQLVPMSGDPRSPATAPPIGVAVPKDLFDFKTNNCLNGLTPGSITVTLTFDTAPPPGTIYYKYGPTADLPLPHWYALPSQLNGNALSFTIVDGDLGDDDLSWNGSITDLGGPASLPSLNIDLDDTVAPQTDGLLLLRYLFGVTGQLLTTEVLGPGWIETIPAITQRLDSLRPLLDVDGNGETDALTDGTILLRYMQGLRGDAMVAGALGANATRTTGPAIEAYLANLGLLPAVTSVTPANGANHVADTTKVVVTFNKPMNPATITFGSNAICAGTVQMSLDDFISCVPFASAVSSAGATTFTLTPQTTLDADTTYRVRVMTSAVDALGLPLTTIFAQPAGFHTAN